MPISPEILDLKKQCVSEQIVVRRNALDRMQEWHSRQPLESLSELVQWARVDDDPEMRERALELLKKIARAEYGQFGQGFIGISLGNPVELMHSTWTKPSFGIPILSLNDNSPAKKAGLLVGDVIFAVGEQIWSTTLAATSKDDGISAKIRQAGVNVMVILQVLRGEQLLSINVRTMRRPAALDRMRLDIGPAGLIAPNQELIDQLSKEERDSDAYFEEWLQRQLMRLQ